MKRTLDEMDKEGPPAEDPKSPTEDPKSPAEEDPESPAEENPESPAEENPESPAEENPESPAEENPEAPAEQDSESPAEEDQKSPAEDQKSPAKDPKSPAEDPKSPTDADLRGSILSEPLSLEARLKNACESAAYHVVDAERKSALAKVAVEKKERRDKLVEENDVMLKFAEELYKNLAGTDKTVSFR